MNDQHLWDLGTTLLNNVYADLADEARQALAQVMLCYRQTKKMYAAVAERADSASVCRDCFGQCCFNGKYRINVLDYLTLHADEIPIVADFTHKPFCPYGTSAGCTMDPGFRPVDCVLFICDAIDRLLTSEAKQLLVHYEAVLRKCCSDAAALTGIPAGTPLMIWAETNDVKTVKLGKGR